MINPEITPGFELATSELVENRVAHQQAELHTNLEALRLLAGAVDVELPEEPRVVLVGKKQNPDYRSRTRHPDIDGSIPLAYDGDIVLKTSTASHITSESLTAGIAMELAKRNLAKRNFRGQCAMGTLMAAGVAAEALHYSSHDTGHTLFYVGLGMFAAGASGLAYYSNRTTVHLPRRLGDFAPPIEVVKLPKHT